MFLKTRARSDFALIFALLLFLGVMYGREIRSIYSLLLFKRNLSIPSTVFVKAFRELYFTNGNFRIFSLDHDLLAEMLFSSFV